jgi:hypothetical protein
VRRTAAKVDNNQAEIVKALRKIPGVSVEVGHDDILVGHLGRTYWFEVKNIDAISKKTGMVNSSEITPSEQKLLLTFTGHYRMVWTLDQILSEIGL